MKGNISYWKFFKSFWSWREELDWLKFIVAVTLVLVLITQGRVEYPDHIEIQYHDSAYLMLWGSAIGLFYCVLLVLRGILTAIFTALLGIESFFGCKFTKDYYNAQVREED